MCATCKNTGIICTCKDPSRHWCDKVACRGRTCPDCKGLSEPMVAEFRPHAVVANRR